MPDSANTLADPPVEAAEARGCAELTFARDPGGRTYVRRQYVSYPYHVCRPLTFAGDPAGMATIYLQSCAGGIFRDDRLHERIVAEAAAAAQVTTQASTIVHSMDRGSARQDVTIDAAAGSFLEVLPDPFILFPQARFASSLRIRAHESATVIVTDSFICHDPGGGGAKFDWFHGDLRVDDENGRVLVLDRLRVSGGMVADGRPGITGAFATQGSLFAVQRLVAPGPLMSALREALSEVPHAYASASELPNGCGAWVRVMADDGVTLRAAMTVAWQAVRRCLTGRTPAPRRK